MTVKALPPAKIEENFEFKLEYWQELKQGIIEALTQARFKQGQRGKLSGKTGYLVLPRDHGCAAGVYYHHEEHTNLEMYTTLMNTKLDLMQEALEDAGFTVQRRESVAENAPDYLFVENYA